MLHPFINRQMTRDQSGQSIVQVLVAVGIMGTVMMCFATMMSNQSRETRALSEKLSSLDLQKFLIASLADGTVCQYVLNNPSVLKFDSTKPFPQTLSLITATQPTPALFASIKPGATPSPGAVVAQVGQPVSPYSSSLIVKDIQLVIASGSGSSFAGNWVVSFDNTKTVRSIRPITVSTTLTANTSAPAAAVITGCQGSGGGGGPSNAGQWCGALSNGSWMFKCNGYPLDEAACAAGAGTGCCPSGYIYKYIQVTVFDNVGSPSFGTLGTCIPQ